MSAAVALAAATGLSSVLGSGLSYAASKYTTDQTNKANRQLAEYQYSKDLEMWNRQNTYNSPQAQMSRFQDAGLNSNLIYSQGNPGNATTIPKYEAPTMQRMDVPRIDMGVAPALDMYYNAKQKDAQISQTKAQTDLIQKQAVTETVDQTTKALQQAQIGVSTARNQFDLNMARQLQTNSLQTAEMNLRNLTRSVDLKAKELSLYPLKQEDLQQSILAKKYQNDYRSYGVSESDNLLYRILARFGHSKTGKGLMTPGMFYQKK